MIKRIIKELKEHSFFTSGAVISALFLVFLIHFYLRLEVPRETFHIFHFLHIIVSAMATGALYYKYRKRVILALLVGILGSLIVGSFSDIIFPFLGGKILGADLHFHLPLIEETFPTLFFAFLGSFLGVVFQRHKTPHFVHVFLSVFASLYYLLVFGVNLGAFFLFLAFFIIFLAVIIPCCLSDIVFPLIFLKNEKE